MATARVFQSGNSQAVRMPKEFRFATSEVEIFRRGEEIVLRERPEGMQRFIDILMSIPEDVFENIRDERPPEDRKGL